MGDQFFTVLQHVRSSCAIHWAVCTGVGAGLFAPSACFNKCQQITNLFRRERIQ